MKPFFTWSAIAVVVAASVAGDVLVSRAMKQVGDVHELWGRYGLLGTVRRILRNPNFWLGILAMAVAFYSLLLVLSWTDVSLVGPATASLTFIGNAIAARIFLRERVDRLRWTAAFLVASGVVLLAV